MSELHLFLYCFVCCRTLRFDYHRSWLNVDVFRCPVCHAERQVRAR